MYFFLILESYFDSFPGLNTNFSEVETLRTHDELGNGEVGNKLNGVLRASLDVKRQRVALLSLPGCFPSSIGDSEDRGGIRHDFLYLVRLYINACLGEDALVEVERHGETTNVSQAEEFPLSRAHNNVAEIANICGDANIFQIDGTRHVKWSNNLLAFRLRS